MSWWHAFGDVVTIKDCHLEFNDYYFNVFSLEWTCSIFRKYQLKEAWSFIQFKSKGDEGKLQRGQARHKV